MSLAIAIVNKENNQESILNCLKSIEKIKNKKIYLTDLQNNIEIKNSIKIKKISEKIYENKNNLIKNIKEEWILFINPWEEIINGYQEINSIVNNKNIEKYKVLLVEDQIINKSVRLFHRDSGSVFQNEIYEEVYDKKSKISNIVFKKNEIIIQNEKEKIELWISQNKINPKPYYYMSCYHIKNKNYIEFKKYSERYIFLETNKNLPSITMTKYYQSIVDLHVFNNIKNSINNIIYCIDQNPCMAEFWCVLGDINFKLNKYQKAIYFYENAIIFGEKRKSDDEFSIEIKKYNLYPNEMIKKCKNLISH